MTHIWKLILKTEDRVNVFCCQNCLLYKTEAMKLDYLTSYKSAVSTNSFVINYWVNWDVDIDKRFLLNQTEYDITCDEFIIIKVIG